MAWLKAEIIAIVALLQPWLIYAWRKYAQRGSVDVYPGGSLEVGFGGFGPTVGLHGTLKASTRDVFVKRLRLSVRKVRNNEEHTFEWLAFAPPKVSLTGTPPTEFELPLSFVVTLAQPHRFVVVFQDADTQRRMVGHVQACRADWNGRFWGAVSAGEVTFPGPGEAWDLSPVRAAYCASPAYREAVDTLNRLLYWDAGDYELVLTLDTDGRPCSRRYAFTLSEEDFGRVRLNVATMLAEQEQAYTNIAPVYYFAYPELRSV